jgi:DNA-binding phage protein
MAKLTKSDQQTLDSLGFFRPEQFIPEITKQQAGMTDSEFEKQTGVARQSIYRLRVNPLYLPSAAILKKLGMELWYRKTSKK